MFRKIGIAVTVMALMFVTALAWRYFVKRIPLVVYSGCYADLEAIDIAKQYWASDNDQPPGAAVTLAELYPRYLRDQPVCPEGGKYEIGKVGGPPTCSIKGPWHTRHYFLNYCRPDFVIGK